MTDTALLSLLNAELNRIKRIEGASNIGIEFRMKDSSILTLKQHYENGAWKWYKVPEIIAEGVLKIAEKDVSQISTSSSMVDGSVVVSTSQHLEIQYIIVENILKMKYFFDVTTTNTATINTDEQGDE
jgi:hypothetical protein